MQRDGIYRGGVQQFFTHFKTNTIDISWIVNIDQNIVEVTQLAMLTNFF